MAAAILAAAIFLSDEVNAKPVVSARSAIVMDADTGRVLWEQKAHERALIASTTKIMTGILVAEECDLQAQVCVPKEAVGIEGSSIYLSTGEKISVEALLYGMMLHSGNDAAAALAIYCGGNLETFVDKMNAKAEKLGLEHTSYANPHGLDSEDNYSTASDLARLTAYAMNDPVFRTVVSTRTATFGNRCFTNHNKLLWSYEGAIGVKTGYTKSAGRILVSCAERDGRRLVAVTISAPNDWQDHSRMLDYGFSAFSSRVVADAETLRISVPVIGGGEDYATAVLRDDFIIPVAQQEKVGLWYDVPKFLYPPLLAGEQAGEAVVYVDGREVARMPLYWRYSVLEGA